jgi:hypothetical protein
MEKVDLAGDGLGWIKLFRKAMDSEVWNPGLWLVWCYCLLKANHKQKYLHTTKGRGHSRSVIIQRGQFMFGRNQAARDCKMPPSTLWGRMKYLQEIGMLDIKSDSNWSIVTIFNYNTYQGDDKDAQQENRLVTDSKPTANRQLTDTTNKDKNEENEEKIPYKEIADIYNELNPKLPNATYRSPERDKLLRGRWNQHKDFQSLDFWKAYFQLVADSSFLQGLTDHKFSNCNLGWLLNPSNFVKVYEGNYTDQKPSTGDSPSGESRSYAMPEESRRERLKTHVFHRVKITAPDSRYIMDVFDANPNITDGEIKEMVNEAVANYYEPPWDKRGVDK